MSRLNRREILRLSAASVLTAGGGGLSVLGCAATTRWEGVDVSSGRQRVIVPGPMAAGASFTGSYRSPQCGELELLQDGARLGGSFYQEGERRSVTTLTGTVHGNLAEFSWQERTRSVMGSAPLKGSGFFLFDLETSGSVRLFGRRTFLVAGEQGVTRRDGGPWTAVRTS
ncbi:MAG TPA: hypothetical protein VGI39_17365 [Polyangiaceae bacterium]|jgi:hypothetical protein